MARRKPDLPALKAIYVDADPKPCDRTAATTYMVKFIDAFVRGPKRDRCRFYLDKDPARFFSETIKALDHRWCRWVEGTESFPQVVAAQVGSEIGVYWDERIEPCLVTAHEAFAINNWADGVFVLPSGQRGVVFDHHWNIAICLRDSK